MTMTQSLPQGDAGCAATRARNRLNRQLDRFAPRHRAAVKAVAAQHRRLTDLAISFPALLFAIAVPRRGCDASAIAAAVIAGASLKDLARLAGLPLWSRRLMPESFITPIEPLPDGDWVARQICNHLPRSPKLAPQWLHAVSTTHRWGTPDMAIWIAREAMRVPKKIKSEKLRLLSLYGFFSGRPETHAGAMIETRWTPAQQWSAALKHADDWQQRLILTAQIGADGVADVWFMPSIIDGIIFVPLRTVAEICEEAKVMQNCVASYGYALERGQTRLWSVRKDDQRVATLSVGSRYRDTIVGVDQIQGPKNGEVAEPIIRAAHQWVRSHEIRMAHRHKGPLPQTAAGNSAWCNLWRPYWLAKKCLPPWLPLSRDTTALFNL